MWEGDPSHQDEDVDKTEGQSQITSSFICLCTLLTSASTEKDSLPYQMFSPLIYP